MAATFTVAARAGGENILHADRQGTTKDLDCVVVRGAANHGPSVQQKPKLRRLPMEPTHGAMMLLLSATSTA